MGVAVPLALRQVRPRELRRLVVLPLLARPLSPLSSPPRVRCGRLHRQSRQAPQRWAHQRPAATTCHATAASGPPSGSFRGRLAPQLPTPTEAPLISPDSGTTVAAPAARRPCATAHLGPSRAAARTQPRRRVSSTSALGDRLVGNKRRVGSASGGSIARHGLCATWGPPPPGPQHLSVPPPPAPIGPQSPWPLARALGSPSSTQSTNSRAPWLSTDIHCSCAPRARAVPLIASAALVPPVLSAGRPRKVERHITAAPPVARLAARPWTAAARVGEARHPGPQSRTATVLSANVTAIGAAWPSIACSTWDVAVLQAVRRSPQCHARTDIRRRGWAFFKEPPTPHGPSCSGSLPRRRPRPPSRSPAPRASMGSFGPLGAPPPFAFTTSMATPHDP